MVVDLSANGIGDGTADDGFGGFDTLTGIENMEGSEFDDTLIGDAGVNILFGGDGADMLTGGDGNDVFVYGDAWQSGIGAGFRDWITDFNAGGTGAGTVVDQIDISFLISGTLSFGDETLAFRNIGATDVRFNAATKILEIDADGDAVADMEIDMTGIVGTLDDSDFIVT